MVKRISIASPLPDSLIANFYEAADGDRNDSAMFVMSTLLLQLKACSIVPNENILWICEDPAYPLRPQPRKLFLVAHNIEILHEWNQTMTAAVLSINWVFSNMINFFKFFNFKENLKVH